VGVEDTIMRSLVKRATAAAVRIMGRVMITHKYRGSIVASFDK
jgi:hypothetical protein